MTDPREIELKFDADPDAVGRLRQRLSERIGMPRDLAKRLTSTYFDTCKEGLRRRGLSLRVRDDGKGRTQTLKGPAHGAFARSEWESAVDADRPDADEFAQKKPRKALRARGALHPIFVTDVARTVWDVRHGQSQIEVALDNGAVTANGDATRLTEVELELKDGVPADLFDLARDLVARADLRLGVQSKSERGYALRAGPSHGPARTEAIQLTPEVPAGQAFRTVARACIRQFRLNEQLLLESRDADALHQARVAIRRLRSALTLFKPVVADAQTDRMRVGLKDLSQRLGEARNLDVYREHVTMLRGAKGASDDLAAYEARVACEREAAYDRVQALLRASDFRLFIVDLAGWIETGGWTNDPANEARDVPIATLAPKVLRKRHRTVLKRGKRLDDGSADDRHQLRIAAKKLRYACEFFEALADGRKARAAHRAFTGQLEDLQERLGALNDLHTGGEMAQRLAGDAAAIAFSASVVAGEDDAQETKLLRKATKTFARVSKAVTPLAK